MARDDLEELLASLFVSLVQGKVCLPSASPMILPRPPFAFMVVPLRSLGQARAASVDLGAGGVRR